MIPTKEVLKAFAHVKSFHPELNSVFFNREGQWHYMNEEFEGLDFSHDDMDISILEDAVDSLTELPFVYQQEVAVEVDEYEDYVVLHSFFYNGESLKSWITRDSYINLFENWDVLMEVVEKIESMGYWVNRVNGDVFIVNDSGAVVVNNQVHEGGIRATYKACVEFAKLLTFR